MTLGEPPLIPWLENAKEGISLMADFMKEVWEPSKSAFQRGDLEEGMRTFINGVMGQATFNKLPASARDAMMDNALEMKAEVLSPGLFSEFSCDDAMKIDAPTLFLTGEVSPPMFRYIIKGSQKIP